MSIRDLENAADTMVANLNVYFFATVAVACGTVVAVAAVAALCPIVVSVVSDCVQVADEQNPDARQTNVSFVHVE